MLVNSRSEPRTEPCALCGEMVGELATTAYWRIVLNYNQDRLGKCFLVLARHDEDVCNLTEEELSDLWRCMRLVKDAVVTCFQPDHFNYMFLMNQDAHVHLHVIPHYRTPRVFAGMSFPVLGSLDGGNVRLPAAIFEQLATEIGSHLPPKAAQ